MPLVRYEVRCEHSLANPKLYRRATRDDPEAVLEGVAMAGLVGIVRQLGDLAEFATKIFQDLHTEIMTIGGRGYDLTTRLQQLEVELPFVEKTLFSESNQIRFAYYGGSNWHASIRSDQNHCTQGGLPPFIQKFYEDCQGPPRLSLLDKFDGAGVGACLKRYTNPSFFMLEWAKSEFMKAQHPQHEKKANLKKEKKRRHIKAQPQNVNQIHSRGGYPLVHVEGFDDGIPRNLASHLKVDNGIMNHLPVIPGASMQRLKSWRAPQVVNSIEKSSTSFLKPLKCATINGGEIAAIDSLPNPLKLSGTNNEKCYDIAKMMKEEEVKNGEGKASNLNEIQKGHEGLSTSEVSILIEMQGHEATRQDSKHMSTKDVPHGPNVPEVSSMDIEDVFYATPNQGDGLKMPINPTISFVGSSSSATIPTMYTSGKHIIEPRVSDLSKFSYSSNSLMSVFSYSTTSSPSTPNSSILNIVSPTSINSTTQKAFDSRSYSLGSPPLNGSSKSRLDPNNQSAKNPKLSLSLMSPSPSLPIVYLEQKDISSSDCGLSNVTTPSLRCLSVHTSSSTFVDSSSMSKPDPFSNPPKFLEPNISNSLVNSPLGHEPSLSPSCTTSLESKDKPPSNAKTKLHTNLLVRNIPLSLSLNTMPILVVNESMGSTSILPPCFETSPKPITPSSPLTNPQPDLQGPSQEISILSIPPMLFSLPSQSKLPPSSECNVVQSSAPTSPMGNVIIKDSSNQQGSPGQSPKSVPGLDTPLCSQFYSQISSFAQFDFDGQSTWRRNLDHEDGNYAKWNTLLERQERSPGSFVLNAQKSQVASLDLNEQESQPRFDHTTIKIPGERTNMTFASSKPKLSPPIEESTSRFFPPIAPDLEGLPKLGEKIMPYVSPSTQLSEELVMEPHQCLGKQHIILEQIKTKSFNLRRTNKQTKESTPHSIANTSVASILEKANAMKQALAKHDEKYNQADEWSDA